MVGRPPNRHRRGLHADRGDRVSGTAAQNFHQLDLFERLASVETKHHLEGSGQELDLGTHPMERRMLEKDIAKFSCSFMSNAKWRKLFSVVNESNLELSNCVWKLVDESEPIHGFVPVQKELGHDYVGDCGALNGPFSFKRIEWLKLPNRIGYKTYKEAPTQFLTQDLAGTLEQLHSLGRFEIEVDSEGVTIYGYKP